MPIVFHAKPFILASELPMCLDLDGVLAGPLAGCSFIPCTVRLVHVRDLRNQRVVGVGVGQHGADGEEDCNVLESKYPHYGESAYP